jgi:hypothetical protein
MNDIKKLIAKAKRPSCSVDLFLGDERVDEYEDLGRQLKEAGKVDDDSLDGGSATVIARRMDALGEAMADSLVSVKMRAMRRRDYNELLDKHPPRRDADGRVNLLDIGGYNQATFFPALIRACWEAPTVEPADLENLLEEVLSDQQYDELANTALRANRGKVDIPFSPAVSRLLGNSEPE